MSFFLLRVFCLCACICAFAARTGAVELNLYCNPTQVPAMREVVADWERDTGNTVVIHSNYESSSEALAFYKELLAAGDSGVDVINLDCVWPVMLAEHLVDLEEKLNLLRGDGWK